jgi:hypothetical protein
LALTSAVGRFVVNGLLQVLSAAALGSPPKKPPPLLAPLSAAVIVAAIIAARGSHATHHAGHDIAAGIIDLAYFGLDGVPFRVVLDFQRFAVAIHSLLFHLGWIEVPAPSSLRLGRDCVCSQSQDSSTAAG